MSGINLINSQTLLDIDPFPWFSYNIWATRKERFDSQVRFLLC